MWKSKRTVITNRRNVKKKKLFFLLSIVFLSIIVLSLYWYYKSLYTMSYVSPLPRTLTRILSSFTPTKQVEESLKKKHISFSSIKVASESSYVIMLSGGEEVLITKKKNIDSQLSSLQLILSRLTIEGKGFSRLDLRFDKPVVVFKDK